MNKQAGLSLAETILIAAIVMIVFAVLFVPLTSQGGYRMAKRAASAQNNRQVALAGIMYGMDYNDVMPLTTNGWLSRMQNVRDGDKTVDCPAPGTQDFPAKGAAGGQRTDAWPMLLQPYIKSRGLYTNPYLADVHNIFSSPVKAVKDAGYDPEGATYRNQNRFPFYGMNYMFVSPLRIPKSKRGLPDAVNYAVSESHKFTEADDPGATVFFTESQRSMTDHTRGFFVINAPGMWPAFANNKNGYVAFWTGTAGSGDWVGLPKPSTNFVFTQFESRVGCNATFLDGHVKFMTPAAITIGTDYLTAAAGAQGHSGSGAKIIDKSKYLWNLTDKNFYGL